MNIIEANVATPDARVAITIARFNNFINDSLLEGAIDALKRIGQVKENSADNSQHYDESDRLIFKDAHGRKG